MCAKSLQSCPTLCNPMDYNLQGSSVSGILQARVLEQVAIYKFSSVQLGRSVVSNSLQPHERSTPGLPVHHQLLEFTQIHVHESVMPFNHLIVSSPSPPAFSLSLIRVFSNESSLYQVAKILEFQL